MTRWVKALLTFGRLPQSRNRRSELNQRDCEAIRLVVVLHVQKRVELDVAGEVNIGLHTPVPLVRLQELVSEEEARVVSAHVAVTGNFDGWSRKWPSERDERQQGL
jgi:hypothetical protein